MHLVYHFRHPTYMDEIQWSLLMVEVAFWESTLWEEHITTANGKLGLGDADGLERAYQDATTLCILVASVLSQCCYAGVTQASHVYQGIPNPPSFTHLWQVEKALEILRDAQKNNKWAKCYIGSWALFILGHAVVRREDIELIRAELYERLSVTSFWEFRRMIDELEKLSRTKCLLSKLATRQLSLHQVVCAA